MTTIDFNDSSRSSEEGEKMVKGVLALNRSPTSPLEHQLQNSRSLDEKNMKISTRFAHNQSSEKKLGSVVSTSDRTVLAGNTNSLSMVTDGTFLEETAQTSASHNFKKHEEELHEISVNLFADQNDQYPEAMHGATECLPGTDNISSHRGHRIKEEGLCHGINLSHEKYDTLTSYQSEKSPQEISFGSGSKQYLLREDIFLPHRKCWKEPTNSLSRHQTLFDNIDVMFDGCLLDIDLDAFYDSNEKTRKLDVDDAEVSSKDTMAPSPTLKVAAKDLRDTIKSCFAAMCVVFSSHNPSTTKVVPNIEGHEAEHLRNVCSNTSCAETIFSKKSKSSLIYQHAIKNDFKTSSIFMRHKKRLAARREHDESSFTSSVDHVFSTRRVKNNVSASHDLLSEASDQNGGERELPSDSTQRPSIPVAVIYMLWCNLIVTKFEQNNREGSDKNFLSDKRLNLIFDLVKETLVSKMKLLRVCYHDWKVGTDKVVAVERTECLQINHDLHLQYGFYLSENFTLFNFFLRGFPEEQRAKRHKSPYLIYDEDTWNSEYALNYVLASCCLSCVNRAKKHETKITMQQLQYEYSIEMLPWHLMRSMCYKSVADLLTDVSFVKGRLVNLDFYDAAKMHIADVEEFYETASSCNIDIDKTMTESYGLIGSLIRSKDVSRWQYEDKAKDDDSGSSISTRIEFTIDLDHVQSVAKSLEALGDSLFSYDKQSEAMKYYYRAMIRYEHINNIEIGKVSNLRNPDKSCNERTLISMGGVLSRVASVYGYKNETADAMLCYEKALTFFSRCQSDQNVQGISNTLASMGEIHFTLEEFDSALSCFNEALVMLRSMNEVRDEVVADLLLVMGNVRREMGELNEALELFSEALYSKVVIYGKSHPEVGFIHHIIGVAFCDKQDFEQAIAHFEKALKIRKSAIALIQSYLPSNDKSGRIQTQELQASESLEFLGKVYETINDVKSSFLCYEESTNIHHDHLLDLAAGDSLILTINDIVMALKLDPECEDFVEDIYSRLHDAIQIGFRLCPIGRIFKSTLKFEDMIVIEGQMAEILYDLGMIRGAQFIHNMATASGQVYERDTTVERQDFTTHLENSVTLRKRRIKNLLEEHGNEVINYERITIAITLYELGKLYSFFVIKNDIDEKEPLRLSLISPNRNLAIRDCRRAIGYFEEAKGILQDSIAMAETLGYAQEDDDVYISRLQLTPTIFEEMLQTMAVLYRKLDHYDKSVECYNEFSVLLTRVELDTTLEESITIGKKEKVAVASKSIGDILFGTGEFPRALESYDEALNLFQASGADNLAIANTLNCKGAVLLKLKRWDDSVLTFSEALRIQVDQLPQDHNDIAETFHSIGKAYEGHGKLEQSLDYYKKAQRIISGRLVDTDTKAADLFHDLGNIVLIQDEESTQFKREKPSEDDISLALTCLALSRDIYTRNFGEEALEVGNALSLLGVIYKKYGEVPVAISSYKKALRIFKDAPLDQSERIKKTLGRLATSLLEIHTENKVELFECLSLARELHEERDNYNNVDYAELMFLFGEAYSKFGMAELALSHYQDALRLYREVLGKKHAIASKTLTKIGACFIHNRKHDEAMKMLQEARQLYCDYNLPNDLTCAEIYFNLGIVYCETNKLNNAIDSYEISMRIRSEILGNDSIEIAQILNNVGSVFARNREYQRALKPWQDAIDIYKSLGVRYDDPKVTCTRGNIEISRNLLTPSPTKEKILRSIGSY